MAIPTYGHDLQTYNAATSTTGWGELTNYTDGKGTEADPDLAIYGTVCITASNRNAAPCSLVYTGTGPSLGTNGVFLIWQKFFAPNSLATESADGIITAVGSTTGNYYGWTMDGSDTYDYGGWVNYAIDPTIGSPDVTQGSPTGTYNTVGMGWDMINGISKGQCMNVDIIRYGRGRSYFANGETSNYATFAGFAAINDNATTGRLGLIQEVPSGYLYKGLMIFGSGATAVDFRDSNTQIIIDNTKKVSTSFNRIEVKIVSSRVDFTSIDFVSLSTVSRGEFEVVDDADVNIESCSFSDMSTFTFQSGSTLIDNSFIRTKQITQSGSTIHGCIFASPTSSVALYVDELSNISSCDFQSDGTGHAMELTTAHSGNSYTLTEFTYDGYASSDGSTGNEVIYNNSQGRVELTINGGDTPTIRNGTDSHTVFVTSVVLTVTVKDTSGVEIENASAYIDQDNDTPFIMNKLTNASGIASTTWTGGAIGTSTWRVRKYGYEPYKLTTNIPASGEKSIPVTLTTDPNQT